MYLGIQQYFIVTFLFLTFFCIENQVLADQYHFARAGKALGTPTHVYVHGLTPSDIKLFNTISNGISSGQVGTSGYDFNVEHEENIINVFNAMGQAGYDYHGYDNIMKWVFGKKITS